MLQGYAEMHGIDISDEAVAFAAERFGRPNMHFMRSDMASLPFDDSTKDVVICLEGFEHVPRETGLRFLHEAKRVLAPGGLLLMTCPVLDEYGRTTGNPYHVCEYPEEELIKRLNHMFSIVELARIAGPDGPEYRAVLQNFKPARYRAVSL